MGAKLAGLVLPLLLLACGRGDRPQVAVGPHTAQRLARTAAIVRGGTAAHPAVLKVLFYGQSISTRKWTDQATALLRARYPNVRFDVRNLAIGGFSAERLERTVARDVAEAYPDLIVFHVYGDHHAYERIIRTMRRLTATEIIVQTDHLTYPMQPVCPVGFHLELHAPPGCHGFLYHRQLGWDDFMAGTFLPEIANRYGLAIEPRRRAWNAYLAARGLAPAALLADGLHPNEAGWTLMAHLFARYFADAIGQWRGEPQHLVASRPAPAADVVRLPFRGNRLELVASGPLDGRVAATIDGRAPAALDGCWQTSRTTMLPAYDWPAIRQVTVAPGLHAAERWTVTVHNLDADQSHWRFDLAGARTGPDGSGTNGEDFLSRSGQVRIAARDWVIHDEVQAFGLRVPEGFRITFDHHFACRDEAPVPLAGAAAEQRHIVATGLANGDHVALLRFAPGARALVREIRSYEPPLHASD